MDSLDALDVNSLPRSIHIQAQSDGSGSPNGPRIFTPASFYLHLHLRYPPPS